MIEPHGPAYWRANVGDRSHAYTLTLVAIGVAAVFAAVLFGIALWRLGG